MKTKALGRGLDALFGEIDEAYDNEGTKNESVLEISLKEIKPNPFQPRKTFNEESLYELSESIKQDGLLQPIVVNEDVEGYTIIAGERRYRASKIAKMKTIRAIVVNSDNQKMRQLALIENIQRDELNPVELAHAYSELIKIHDITQEELSGKIHKSRTHITNTIRLLQLSTKTQKAIVENKITAGHAKVLVGLDEKEQKLMVDSIIGQKLSVREVENMVKNMKNFTHETPMKKPETVSYNFENFKEKFDLLGYKTKFSKNVLSIEFESQEQVETFAKEFLR